MMHHSPEALLAFVEAAMLGSFSAAARKLGKSQSTISGAIANLEVDLGVTLFDRSTRKPALTEHGRLILGRVQDILAATDRLDRTALQLVGGLESRLTLVLSDAYQSVHYERTMRHFEQRYPDLSFECLAAEGADLVALIQSGRAHIGLVQEQAEYPPDIGAAVLSERSEIALYVAVGHALAQAPAVDAELLAGHRQIRLAQTFMQQPAGRGWSAPSYLMMLEMTTMGFGWAALPSALVKQFANDRLTRLTVRGWPRRVQIDAVWSRQRTLGPAGGWLLEQMLAQA
ncbi:MAG: LysR family transcriptional regulator [Herbaspirillum sp.]|jgi:DNA-binding transcriptional LysR family regulator|nr:LysR family transcriptional regulator [Herbaspirillum sp.]